MSESNIEIKIEPEEERAEAVLSTNFTKTSVFNVKEELKEPEELLDMYVADSIWLNDVKVELPRVETETDCNNSNYLGNENVECETEIIPDIKVKEEFAQIEFISLPNIQYESNDYFNCKVKKETTELELKQNTSTESVYQQPKLTFLKCTVNLQRQEYSNVTFFVCEYCKKLFQQKTNLQDHLITHQKISLMEVDYINEPFKCDKCGYITSQKDIMNTHMKLHNLDDYSNRFSAYIALHSLTRTDELPHKCNQCGYSGAQKKALKNHMIMHSKEQKYLCDVCDFKTSSKIKLSKHKRDHIDKHSL